MADEISRVRVADPHTYYADIGRFVIVYGLAEAMVKDVLRSKSGLDAQMGVAVLSGVRADTACSLLRKCYAAKGESVPDAVERLLVQFALVTTFRNDLLHHGIDFSRVPPVSTNREGVLNVNAVREHVIEPDTLAGATEDCARIMLGLSTVWGAKYLAGAAAERAEETLNYASSRPWNYKPPAPANKGRSGRQKPAPRRSKRLPPQSSQE